MAFYVGYSLMFGANVAESVWIDLMQEIRPYTIVFCTWILNPQFTKKQKKWMLATMVVTLGSWIFYHPESLQSENAEFPVLGQLAMYLLRFVGSVSRYQAMPVQIANWPRTGNSAFSLCNDSGW